MKETYITITEKGIVNKQPFINFLKSLGSGRFLIKAEKKDKRSLSQNAYYWKIVVPMVLDGLQDAGYNVKTKFQSHEIMKELFLSEDIVNETTGERLTTITRSTADLNKEQFNKFFEEIWRWASEYLNIVIPEPNQQTEFNYD
jgi:uncharacterized protein YegL